MNFSQYRRLFDIRSLDEAKSLLYNLYESQSNYYREKLRTMPDSTKYSEFTESGISFYGWEVIFLAEFESRASDYLSRIETHERQLKDKGGQELYKKNLYEDILSRIERNTWRGKIDADGRRVITYQYGLKPKSKLPKFNFQQENENLWGGNSGWAWSFFIASHYDALIYPIFLKTLNSLAIEGLIFYNSDEIKLLENPPQKALFKIVKVS